MGSDVRQGPWSAPWALMCTMVPGVRGRLWRGRCWDGQHLADRSANPSLMLGVGYAHSLSEPWLPCQL